MDSDWIRFFEWKKFTEDCEKWHQEREQMNLEEFWKKEKEKSVAQLTCNCTDICCSPLSPNCRASKNANPKCFPPLSEQEKKMTNPYKCNCGPLEVCMSCCGRKHRNYAKRLIKSHASGGYSTPQVCKIYGWPTGQTGNPLPLCFIELGGGFDPAAIQAQFTKDGCPVPNIKVISVDGATNAYTGDPQSADVEVELDLVVGGESVSYITGQPAQIEVYFAPNSDQGFIDAVNAVAKRGNCICSISWGSPETNWSQTSINQMDQGFASGNVNGVTWTVAAGDNDANDGTSKPTGDYPGTSPFVVCCGGTTLLPNGNESVWNSGGGEGTGGGFSAVEKIPAYQNGFVSGNFRAVPDLCGNADPATGYQTPFGVIGGTSAVAPLMAGFFAACKKPFGNINNLLYPNEVAFSDITVGNNSGFSAGKGYDEASGLGRATSQLFAILAGTVVTPPPTTNPPPVTNPTPPTPTEPTLQEVVAQINATCSQTEKQVARIFARFTEYLRVKIESDLQTLYAKKGNWFKNWFKE